MESNKIRRFKPNTGSKNKKFSNPSKQRGYLYDKTWNIYRVRFLFYNPNCYVCMSKSTVVDHIVAHKGDEKLFKKLNNHMPLCKKCHDEITGLFDQFLVPKTDKKVEWINKKREESRVDIKIKVLGYYQ